MTLAINIKDLRKKYGDLEVLKGINLEVEEGDFFWLLWHNWAGKTTMIWILTDLVLKTSGKVEVFGHDLDKDKNAVKLHIWVVPQEFNFEMFGKVINVPVTQWGYYWVPYKEALKRTQELLTKLQIWDKKDATPMSLSWWMKRRLMIARALVHQPKILILDEPTAWVDVELRKLIWEFLTDLNKKWTTILLTTHYLEEAEQLCNKIAIINKGQIIENTNKKKLLQKLTQSTIIVECEWSLQELPAELEKFDATLDKENHTIELTYTTADYTLNDIIDILIKNWVKITNISNKTNRLEQLFISLTK